MLKNLLLKNYRDSIFLEEDNSLLISKQGEIEKIKERMRDFLIDIQKEYPSVLGFLLFGSRMDLRKKNTEASDLDLVLIVDKKFNGFKQKNILAKEFLFDDFRSLAKEKRLGVDVELSTFIDDSEFLNMLEGRYEGDLKHMIFIWSPGSVHFVGTGNPFGLSESDINNDLSKNFFTSNSVLAYKRHTIQTIRDGILNARRGNPYFLTY